MKRTPNLEQTITSTQMPNSNIYARKGTQKPKLAKRQQIHQAHKTLGGNLIILTRIGSFQTTQI